MIFSSSRDELHGARQTGRLAPPPDFRDMDHLLDEDALRRFGAQQKPLRARPWKIGAIRDQKGNTCVINTYYGFRQAAPWFVRDLGISRSQEYADYKLAQQNDEITPEGYEGTTARGMCKVAKDRGEITEYLWVPTHDGEDIVREWLKTRGCLMAGSDWPEAFFTPDKHGYVTPTDNKTSDLGHETLLRWYYGPTHYRFPDTYEFVNSWSASWGDKGLYRMKADVFRWLYFQSNGDLVSPIETARARRR